MLPITPSTITDQDQYNKSINKVLSGNIGVGSGITFDSNEQPLTFNPDNLVGIVIRIGSTANPNGLLYKWTSSNVDLIITHNLNKIPFGYVVIAKSGPCDVYWGSSPASNTTITLRCTDATQGTTILFLC